MLAHGARGHRNGERLRRMRQKKAWQQVRVLSITFPLTNGKLWRWFVSFGCAHPNVPRGYWTRWQEGALAHVGSDGNEARPSRAADVARQNLQPPSGPFAPRRQVEATRKYIQDNSAKAKFIS